jgi:tRNA nucleotidyltransferase (CCA-adding enzyme)
MEVYKVGGSVRDHLMGVNAWDVDWVVVGACAQDLLDKGYLQVGADFPVFLHPHSQDEYALARTERKSGPGYLGFDVQTENVTLEEDLMRRDLTINAMALTADGMLIDPYGGKSDIENKVIRHVGPAFVEDPVRILRVFRFLARFGPDWTIAPETQALIHHMVQQGDASSLVGERIWKETSRALMEQHPQQYLKSLAEFSLTSLPCFEVYRNCERNAHAVGVASERKLSLNARVALALGHAAQTRTRPAGLPGDAWKAIQAQVEFVEDPALLDPCQHPERVVLFLDRVGAFKGSELLTDLLTGWECQGRDVSKLRQASAQALAVDIQSIAQAMPQGPAVGHAIRAARIAAI